MPPAISSTPRRWLGLQPRIAVGLGLALASLLGAGAFSAFALRARTQSADLVSHATASALALEEVESALLVAHASVDAYLGTRDPRHRQRHQRAWSKLEPALEELTKLVGAEPEEAKRLARLVPEVRTIKAEHAEALALADGGDFDAALALRRRNVGTSALERGKEAIEELELHETREVEARQLSAARTVAVSNAGFLIAQGVLLVLVVLAARLVHDEIRAREENEAARARALDFQQRLMGVVSHDLRNPLTGILAAGWALSRAGLAEPEALLARRIVGAGSDRNALSLRHEITADAHEAQRRDDRHRDVDRLGGERRPRQPVAQGHVDAFHPAALGGGDRGFEQHMVGADHIPGFVGDAGWDALAVYGFANFDFVVFERCAQRVPQVSHIAEDGANV